MHYQSTPLLPTDYKIVQDIWTLIGARNHNLPAMYKIRDDAQKHGNWGMVIMINPAIKQLEERTENESRPVEITKEGFAKIVHTLQAKSKKHYEKS